MWPFSKKADSVAEIRKRVLARMEKEKERSNKIDALTLLIQPIIKRALAKRAQYDCEAAPIEGQEFWVSQEELDLLTEYEKALCGEFNDCEKGKMGEFFMWMKIVVEGE
jgi:hypothetical protein